MEYQWIWGLGGWLDLPCVLDTTLRFATCFVSYYLLSPSLFCQKHCNTEQNLHGTGFPRSGPHPNSRIPVKKLEWATHTLPADVCLSPLPCPLGCLVIKVTYVNGITAYLS